MRIEPVEIRGGDVLVVYCPHALSEESVKIIQDMMAEKFPEHKVVVLSAGLTLSVLRFAA